MKKFETFKYITQNGIDKRIRIVKPEFSIDGLTKEEIESLKILQESQKYFAKIQLRQNHPKGLEMALNMESENQITKDYFGFANTIYDVNGDNINSLSKYSLNNWKLSGKYPQDMSVEEFNSIPDELRTLKHSIIIREEKNKNLKVIKNSKFFKKESEKVIENLNKLKTKIPELSSYIDATTSFLKDENKDTIYNHFKEWMNHSCNVDFLFDTAQEEGSDMAYGQRGSASSCVFRNVNKKYKTISDILLENIEELDQTAPWKYKVENFKKPALKFLDVLSFRGNHLHFPLITLAQNLPNEQYLKDSLGNITLVYANIIESKKRAEAPFYRSEFFPHIDKSLEALIPEAEMYLVTAHEFGHATSREIHGKNANELFKPNLYYTIEEGRAETFALYSMTEIQKKGLISPKLEEIGYYTMLEAMCESLTREEPLYHRSARNLMFHYMLDAGGIVEGKNEDNLPIYSFNMNLARNQVKDLLGILGDIRSTGDVNTAKELQKKYVRTTHYKEFEQRFLEKGANGNAYLFPEINKKLELEYPNSLSDQKTSIYSLLK